MAYAPSACIVLEWKYIKTDTEEWKEIEQKYISSQEYTISKSTNPNKKIETINLDNPIKLFYWMHDNNIKYMGYEVYIDPTCDIGYFIINDKYVSTDGPYIMNIQLREIINFVKVISKDTSKIQLIMI